MEDLELGGELSIVDSVLAGHLPKHVRQVVGLIFASFVEDCDVVIQLVRVVSTDH